MECDFVVTIIIGKYLEKHIFKTRGQYGLKALTWFQRHQLKMVEDHKLKQHTQYERSRLSGLRVEYFLKIFP